MTPYNPPHAYSDLLRYRREVAALYAELRASGSATPDAFGRFEAGCDALFAEHPQSPLDSAQRRSFSGLAELHQPKYLYRRERCSARSLGGAHHARQARRAAH